jgi:predicted dehydrogenase
MERIAESGFCDIVAVCDQSVDLARAAAAAIARPEVTVTDSANALADLDLDGLVIATPSALHADQAIAALERGVSVFCQKPLARTADETRNVVNAARSNDCLLSVDLSYRYTNGVRHIRDLVQRGELGQVYAVDLVFHNAYGPDKAWFFDPALSGGGCVIDLGVHLVDLALWTLGAPRVAAVSSRLYARGRPIQSVESVVEDYAVARLDLDTGASVQLACSWNLPAGRDAIISAAFYGTLGGAAVRNVNGSFFDFIAERYRGTSRETLAVPPDDWGGRAAVDWSRRLAEGDRYDPDVERLVDVAAVLDRIYQR